MASMCGAILGGIHGVEWMGQLASSVQDSRYIAKTATSLIEGSPDSPPNRRSRVTKHDLLDFERRLRGTSEGAKLRLPDGRHGSMQRVKPMFSETAEAELCIVQVEDGQTLAVKRIQRRQRTPRVPAALARDQVLRVGIKIFVSDLAEAREFYVEKLRLPMVKEYASGFTVADVISIHLAKCDGQKRLAFHTTSALAPTPCVRMAGVDSLVTRLSEGGIAVTPVIGSSAVRAFRILDPFGNQLEFFEA
jgi:catechol 2,3-dioxygenase-like lactoylglutathione lyase family enzyme